MKDSEIVAYLKGIEGKYPVNEWIVSNRHIWPLVKMVICSTLSDSGASDLSRGKSRFNNLRSKVKRYKDIFSFIPNTSHDADVLIFHHNNARNLILDDGTEFDFNLDPFTIMLESECEIYSLEYMSGSNYVKTFRKSFKIDGYINRAHLFSKLNMGDSSAFIHLNKYDDFLNECSEELRGRLEKWKIYQSVVGMNRLSEIFLRMVKRKRIKFVICGCGYGTDTASLFMACKDAGIKCMEVQHGLAAGSGHRWYSSWTKMPTDGSRYEMLPDIYWCWTNRDAGVIESWAQGRHVVHVGKKPIYSVMRDVEEMTENHSFDLPNRNPCILFSLQPGIQYPEWINNVIRKTSINFNWIIRRHSRIDNTQEKLIQDLSGAKNVYINGIESVMLEKLLKQSNLHITNHSAVALDAIEFNVKSIILGSEYEELFSKEIMNGYVYPGYSESTVINLIYKLCTDSHEGKTPFKEVGKENLHFLQNLI